MAQQATAPADQPAEDEAAPAAEPQPEPEVTAPEPEPMPTNVIQALARVEAELPGIGKTMESEQGYKYRGIESITAEVQALFGKYGVVFVPRITRRDVKPMTINQRPWTEDEVEVVYTVYGPGGVEDKIEVGPLIALGRDNSDKGINKCMTQAFKYALLQTLCIGDGKDDADKDAAATPDAAPAAVDPVKQARQALYGRISHLTPAGREEVRKFCDEHDPQIPRVTGRMDDDQLELVTELVDAIESRKADELKDKVDAKTTAPPAEAATSGDADSSITNEEPKPEPAPTLPPPDLPFDVTVLPMDKTAEADLAWVAASPDGMMTTVSAEVAEVADPEVKSRLKAVGLSTSGGADRCRVRLSARMVRTRMERMAQGLPERVGEQEAQLDLSAGQMVTAGDEPPPPEGADDPSAGY